jgi:hypothetical protein
MTWFAVVDAATGELVSTGTTVAEELDERLEVIELGDELPAGVWDAQARRFVEAPPAPTVDERLADDPDFKAMTAGEKRITRTILRQLRGTPDDHPR